MSPSEGIKPVPIPGEGVAPSEIEPRIVDQCSDFISEYLDDRNGTSKVLELARNSPRGQQTLHIPFPDLSRFDENLAADFLEDPITILSHFKEALLQYDLPIDADLNDIYVRPTGLEHVDNSLTYDLSEIHSTATNEGLFIVSAQVTNCTENRGWYSSIKFMCQRCESITEISQIERIQRPNECRSCEWTGPFSVHTYDSIPYQQIHVQQPPERIKSDPSGHSMCVQLFGEDLLNEITVGDRILFACTVVNDEDSNETPTFNLMGRALAIEHQERKHYALDIDGYEDDIQEIANSEDPLQVLVDSFLPTHWGDKAIKLALLLQQFGGVEKKHLDGTETRGRIHVCLVGDPATDKSRILRYAQKISPHGVYTAADSAITTERTCGAVQSESSNANRTNKSGALVEANKGICALDELGTIDEQVQELLNEVMAYGAIGTSRAGFAAKLPLRAAVLAAANPKHGRYDQYEPIGEQIDLTPSLLRRFDLLLVTSDDPSEDADFAEHLLETQQEAQKRAAKSHPNNSEIADEGRESSPQIGPELLQRYIAYAKRRCTPVMNDEALNALRDFYVDVRSDAQEDAPIPITARTLESMVRLAEASARARLSEHVTIDDAERAIRITRRTMQDVGVDPKTGEFDADVVETGTTKTQRDRSKAVKTAIDQLTQDGKAGALHEAVIQQLDRRMHRGAVEDEINKLKDEGEVYEPEKGRYRTT